METQASIVAPQLAKAFNEQLPQIARSGVSSIAELSPFLGQALNPNDANNVMALINDYARAREFARESLAQGQTCAGAKQQFGMGASAGEHYFGTLFAAACASEAALHAKKLASAGDKQCLAERQRLLNAVDGLTQDKIALSYHFFNKNCPQGLITALMERAILGSPVPESDGPKNATPAPGRK